MDSHPGSSLRWSGDWRDLKQTQNQQWRVKKRCPLTLAERWVTARKRLKKELAKCQNSHLSKYNTVDTWDHTKNIYFLKVFYYSPPFFIIDNPSKGHLTIKEIGLTLWKVSVEGLLLFAWIINLNGGHMNAWCRPPTHKIQYGCPAWPWHKSSRMPSVLQSHVEAAAWPSSSPPQQQKKRGGSWRGRAQTGENSITGQGRLGKRRAEGRRRASLCCAELQMLCTQSIGYYCPCRQKEKKKNKANSVCLLSHKILHDGDSSSGAANPPLPTLPTPAAAVWLPFGRATV